MRTVLIFYATTDGQTRRIAERISRDIGARGFDARAIDVTSAEAEHIDWDECEE
jgi:flavodoxin